MYNSYCKLNYFAVNFEQGFVHFVYFEIIIRSILEAKFGDDS